MNYELGNGPHNSNFIPGDVSSRLDKQFYRRFANRKTCSPHTPRRIFVGDHEVSGAPSIRANEGCCGFNNAEPQIYRAVCVNRNIGERCSLTGRPAVWSTNILVGLGTAYCEY